MRRVLITCSMIENEIKAALKYAAPDLEVIWMDKGMHSNPQLLGKTLQETIDSLSGADEILLGYCLCGKGTEGLCSDTAVIKIPRFDDCINMMLFTGTRKTRGLVDLRTMYYTAGWVNEEGGFFKTYDRLAEEYDEELALEIVREMCANYENVAAIDTGCYDIHSIDDKIEKIAKLMDLKPGIAKGSNKILEALIKGENDPNIIILKPGERLSLAHF